MAHNPKDPNRNPRDPNRKHVPQRGSKKTPLEQLSPLGQFVERMLPELSRRQQCDFLKQRLYLGEKDFGWVVHGRYKPSQKWIARMGWRELLASTDAWKAQERLAFTDPAQDPGAQFDAIIKDFPAVSDFEIQPAVKGTMGEVFELAMPDMTRVQQSRILYYKDDPAKNDTYASRIAVDDFLITQQQMAVHGRAYLTEIKPDAVMPKAEAITGYRNILRAQCAIVARETGNDPWPEVAEKFDALAVQRIADRPFDKNKPILREWCRAAGEVFAQIRKDAGFEADMDGLLRALGENIFPPPNLFEERFAAEKIAEMENGKWFNASGRPHLHKSLDVGAEEVVPRYDAQGKKIRNPHPFTTKDLETTRALYVQLAQRMAVKLLKDAVDGNTASHDHARQTKHLDALYNLFPELTPTGRKILNKQPLRQLMAG